MIKQKSTVAGIIVIALTVLTDPTVTAALAKVAAELNKGTAAGVGMALLGLALVVYRERNRKGAGEPE